MDGADRLGDLAGAEEFSHGSGVADGKVDHGGAGIGVIAVVHDDFAASVSVNNDADAFTDLGVDEVVIRCMSIDQADALETLELAGEVRAALLG